MVREMTYENTAISAVLHRRRHNNENIGVAKKICPISTLKTSQNMSDETQFTFSCVLPPLLTLTVDLFFSQHITSSRILTPTSDMPFSLFADAADGDHDGSSLAPASLGTNTLSVACIYRSPRLLPSDSFQGWPDCSQERDTHFAISADIPWQSQP
jgi:hypothetical protein